MKFINKKKGFLIGACLLLILVLIYLTSLYISGSAIQKNNYKSLVEGNNLVDVLSIEGVNIKKILEEVYGVKLITDQNEDSIDLAITMAENEKGGIIFEQIIPEDVLQTEMNDRYVYNYGCFLLCLNYLHAKMTRVKIVKEEELLKQLNTMWIGRDCTIRDRIKAFLYIGTFYSNNTEWPDNYYIAKYYSRGGSNISKCHFAVVYYSEEYDNFNIKYDPMGTVNVRRELREIFSLKRILENI